MEGFKELMQQAHGGDKGARDTLIAGNLGLVHTIANRFEHRVRYKRRLSLLFWAKKMIWLC